MPSNNIILIYNCRYKNGQLVTPDDHVKIRTDLSSSQSELTIRGVTKKDKAVYRCHSQKDLSESNTECYLYVYSKAVN